MQPTRPTRALEPHAYKHHATISQTIIGSSLTHALNVSCLGFLCRRTTTCHMHLRTLNYSDIFVERLPTNGIRVDERGLKPLKLHTDMNRGKPCFRRCCNLYRRPPPRAGPRDFLVEGISPSVQTSFLKFLRGLAPQAPHIVHTFNFARCSIYGHVYFVSWAITLH